MFDTHVLIIDILAENIFQVKFACNFSIQGVFVRHLFSLGLFPISLFLAGNEGKFVPHTYCTVL